MYYILTWKKCQMFLISPSVWSLKNCRKRKHEMQRKSENGVQLKKRDSVFFFWPRFHILRSLKQTFCQKFPLPVGCVWREQVIHDAFAMQINHVLTNTRCCNLWSLSWKYFSTLSRLWCPTGENRRDVSLASFNEPSWKKVAPSQTELPYSIVAANLLLVN